MPPPQAHVISDKQRHFTDEETEMPREIEARKQHVSDPTAVGLWTPALSEAPGEASRNSF